MRQTRRTVIKLTVGAVADSRLLSAGTSAVLGLLGCSGGSSNSGSGSGTTAPNNLSYSTPDTGTVGTALASLTPTVSGSVTSYSISPALPAGLMLNTSTGVISGTPTAAAALTTYTVTASNAGGSATFAIVLTIVAGTVAPSNLSYPTPDSGTVGTAFASLTPTVSGSVTSYSISPALPAGLTLNTSTGVISGTPTAAASLTTYTVMASNAGGSATFAIAITIVGSIVISSSTSSPTALTPVALKVVGLNFATAFTVQLTNSSGYSGVLTPVRTDAVNGVVVVAAPLYINPTTGSTGPLTASVQITQGVLTSNALAWQIADLPSVVSYGVNPGDISRGFLNAQSIYFGMNVNALQAMRALPTSKTNTSTVQSKQMAQQISTIEARSNVDLIVTGKQSALSVGKTTNGAAINYTSASVDIQDRIFALYLQSIGYLPTTIYSGTPAVVMSKPYVRRQSRKARIRQSPLSSWSAISAVSFVGRAIGSTSPKIDFDTPRITPVPLTAHRLSTAKESEPKALPTASQIIKDLGVAGGAIGVTNAAIQTNTAKNSIDSFIAIGQGVTTAALVVGTVAGTIVGAPELVAAATVVGAFYGLAALANDGYKWYTASNAIADATSSGNSAKLASAQSELLEAQSNVGLDAIGLVLGPLGFPKELGTDVGLGAQVVNALTEAQSGGTGITVQGLSLLSSAVGLLVTQNGSEASADAQSVKQSNLEIPASATSFGLVDGSLSVTNSNGPGLAPLSGAYMTEPDTNTAFSTLAGTDDNYTLIVPLDVPGYKYNDMSLETYDPVAFETTGSPIILNLSGLTATVPVNASPISGACVDTDAGDPDEDDPDCD